MYLEITHMCQEQTHICQELSYVGERLLSDKVDEAQDVEVVPGDGFLEMIVDGAEKVGAEGRKGL